ncbi:hypothetical protein FRC07_006438 [Ceratobasidium sp. 392]|nr:hypothetical protein FRC07_006438 [Ceratobasidium sp. 392]
MSRENKKRKLDDEDYSSWSKNQAAAFVGDVNDLQKSLRKCYPSNFLRALIDSLNECEPHTIQTIKDLVDPILEANMEPRHCVRCHNPFRESENKSGSCVVLCGFNTTPTGWSDEANIAIVTSSCCGKVRRVIDVPDTNPVCYRVRHTVIARHVKYFKDPATIEAGIKYVGHNPGVVTCATIGCGSDGSELSELSDLEEN